MAIRVIPGEIGAKDVTTRTVIPTVAQPRWPPFERVAETIATPRRPFPPHRHEGVEVFAYVTEGSASHEFGSRPVDPLVSGSTMLLTAPTVVSHAMNPREGRTVRWFSVVAKLPPNSGAAPRLQSGRAEPAGGKSDESIVRRLIGPGTGLTSAAGLDGVAVEYRAATSTFQKIGHDRIALCYALSGRGTIDNQALDEGEAALVDDSSGVALHGQRGFHAVLVSAPRAP